MFYARKKLPLHYTTVIFHKNIKKSLKQRLVYCVVLNVPYRMMRYSFFQKSKRRYSYAIRAEMKYATDTQIREAN